MIKVVQTVFMFYKRGQKMNWGVGSLMFIFVGKTDPDSILNETMCISQSTITQEKGMNPIILFPAVGK